MPTLLQAQPGQAYSGHPHALMSHRSFHTTSDFSRFRVSAVIRCIRYKHDRKVTAFEMATLFGAVASPRQQVEVDVKSAAIAMPRSSPFQSDIVVTSIVGEMIGTIAVQSRLTRTCSRIAAIGAIVSLFTPTDDHFLIFIAHCLRAPFY